VIHLGQQYALGVQAQVTLKNVNVEPDASLTLGTYDGFMMDPPTDFVDLTIINSKLIVKGIPSYDQSLIGTDNYHSNTIINPYGAHLDLDNSNQITNHEIFGLTNFVGPIRQYGKKASPVLYAGTTNADFTGPNQLSPGQLIAKLSDIGTNRMVISRVKSADLVGGIGPITVTATTVATSNLVTVSSVAGLKQGLDVQFVGDGGDYTIRYIRSATQIQLQSAVATTLTGVAMSVFPHTFESFLLPSSAGALPTTGTWARGDIVLNNTAAEAGTAGSKYVITGWVCVTAGTPGSWLQMRTLTGN
jgi:hypothetical protein